MNLFKKLCMAVLVLSVVSGFTSCNGFSNSNKAQKTEPEVQDVEVSEPEVPDGEVSEPEVPDDTDSSPILKLWSMER